SNVRSSQDLAGNLEWLREGLVRIGGDRSGGSMGGGGGAPVGTQGAVAARRPATMFAGAGALGWPRPIFLAQNMGGMGSGVSPGGGAGTPRPRLPGGAAAATDMPPAGLMDAPAMTGGGGMASLGGG